VSLNVDVEVLRGDFVLEAAFAVSPGETLALLGPNGSGKSTLLATIAGLLVPHRGEVTVNGRTLTEADGSGRLRATPPHQRKMGLLGQDPLLFPHLSARENIAFGMRAAGMKTEGARSRAREWLAEVGLDGLGERRPAELSGGQQQRVAIARVLATEPDVLLLDEPMAALDVENASLVRSLLRDRLSQLKLATIVVTHDVVDALVLADRVAILDEGRIIDSGVARVVLGQPVNQFAARLAGRNLLCGEAGDGAAGGGAAGDGAAGNGAAGSDAAKCRAFPPTAVRLTAREANPGASDGATAVGATNTGILANSAGPNTLTWDATVARLEPAARGVRVSFAGETVVAELSAAELLASDIQEGTSVTVSVDPAFVTVYTARNPISVRGR